jgi:hypothetical protein
MAGFLQMVSASRNAGRGQHRGPATWQLCAPTSQPRVDKPLGGLHRSALARLGGGAVT